MSLRNAVRDAYRSAIECSPLGGRVFWRASHSCGIALTFDDGPDPCQTPKILDILAEHHACATFFVLGEQADRYPHLVRRIAAEGHVLGNHTYTHFHCPELDLNGLMRQIERTDTAIQTALGADLAPPPDLFRPPFGELLPAQALYLALRRRRIAFWTRDSRDYRGASAEAIAAVGSTLSPGDTLLMHDRFPNTVEALPALLEGLERRGLRTVTLEASRRAAAPVSVRRRGISAG